MKALKLSKKSNGQILVACGADNEYAEWIPELKSKIKDETVFAIAGYPKDLFSEFSKLGIENYIHVKSNLINELSSFQKAVGIV